MTKLTIAICCLLLTGCEMQEKEGFSNKTVLETDSPSVKVDNNTNQIREIKFVNTILPDSVYGTWTYDISGPHADFVIDSNYFFYVDHGGQEQLSYKLNNDTLIIYEHDAIDTSFIIKAQNDTLILRSVYSEEHAIAIRRTN